MCACTHVRIPPVHICIFCCLAAVSSSLETPLAVVRHAALSMGFPSQEFYRGLPFPSPGFLPDPGIEPTSAALASRFFTTEPPGKTTYIYMCILFNPQDILDIGSVQSLSHVWLFATPWTAARQASLSITNSRSFPKLMSIESVMPSNHHILWCPLLFPPLIFPSIRVFSHESALRIRGPKCWSFSFSISPSNEYSGLVGSPFVQETLKSLFQHHCSKASILWH